MADDNKPLKYLRYAIGEIVLVMVGILLALQVNNWNIEHKSKLEIKSSLSALKDDLIKDSLLISEYLPYVIQQYELNESFRTRLKAPGATEDTLIKIARYEFDPAWLGQFTYNTNAYSKMATNGLLELVEDSLKIKIINFYNRRANNQNSINQFKTQYGITIADYIKTYNFNSVYVTGPGDLINELTWRNLNIDEFAPAFNRLSLYKKFLFLELKNELEFSLEKSRDLLKDLK